MGIFVEIDELEFVKGPTGDTPLWVECARWRNGVEEDVTYGEDGAEQFTSAENAAMLRGFFVLRELLQNRCAALFDLADVHMSDIGRHLVQAVEGQLKLDLDEATRGRLLETIEAHHHHAGTQERHKELLKKAQKRTHKMAKQMRRAAKLERKRERAAAAALAGPSLVRRPSMSSFHDIVKAASDHAFFLQQTPSEGEPGNEGGIGGDPGSAPGTPAKKPKRVSSLSALTSLVRSVSESTNNNNRENNTDAASATPRSTTPPPPPPAGASADVVVVAAPRTRFDDNSNSNNNNNKDIEDPTAPLVQTSQEHLAGNGVGVHHTSVSFAGDSLATIDPAADTEAEDNDDADNDDAEDDDGDTTEDPEMRRFADFEVDALDILIGSTPYLTETFCAFVRLKRSVILSNVAEEGYRTRFIFLCLGPAKVNDSMWHIGRSFAILASRNRHCEQFEMAQSTADLTAICTDFLENSFIMPDLQAENNNNNNENSSAAAALRAATGAAQELLPPPIHSNIAYSASNVSEFASAANSNNSYNGAPQLGADTPLTPPTQTPLEAKGDRLKSSLLSAAGPTTTTPTSPCKGGGGSEDDDDDDDDDESNDEAPPRPFCVGKHNLDETPNSCHHRRSSSNSPMEGGTRDKKKPRKGRSLLRRISQSIFDLRPSETPVISKAEQHYDDDIAASVPLHVARVNRRMAAVRRLNERQMDHQIRKKKLPWSRQDKIQIRLLVLGSISILLLILLWVGPTKPHATHGHETHMHDFAAVIEGLAPVSADFPFEKEMDYTRPYTVIDIKLVVQDKDAGESHRRRRQRRLATTLNETAEEPHDDDHDIHGGPEEKKRKIYVELYDYEGTSCLKKRIALELEKDEEAEMLKTVRPKLGECKLGLKDGYWELTTNSLEPIAFIFEADGYDDLALGRVWAAAVVLILVYGAIVLDLLHRTLVAMVGSFIALAMLAVLGSHTDMETSIRYMDEGTLALLFGMMIMVNLISTTGAFEWLAVRALERSRGQLNLLMPLLAFSCAGLSAFLDNVTTMLLMAPVTIELCSVMGADPTPLLVSEVLFSNVGGTATMIGDPPNIIIGNMLSEDVGFADFVINLMPCILLASGPAFLYLRWHYSAELAKETKLMDYRDLKKRYVIVNPVLLTKASIVLSTVLLLFFLHPLHHVDTAWIACIGALALMIVATPHELHHVFEHVEWDTLLFFAALFVMIEAMAAMGLIRAIGKGVATIISAAPASAQLRVAMITILWISAIVSGFLDNIPYTATMVPVIEALARDETLNLNLKPLVWALSLGACLGGNLTLVGASANLVTASAASHAGFDINFIKFMKVGAPVTFLTVMVSTIYCLVIYDVMQ